MIKQLLYFQNKKEREFWLSIINSAYQPTVIIPDVYTHQQEVKKLAVAVPQDTASRMMALSGKNDYNLYAVLTSTVLLTLCKWVDSRVVSVGIPELKNKQQPLNDYLIHCQQINEQDAFKHVLMQAKETIVQAYQHSNFPLEQIADGHSGNESRLFDIAVRLEALHGSCTSSFKGSLQWNFTRASGSIALDVWYNGSQYATATIQKLANCFLWVAEQVFVHTVPVVEQITLVKAAEAQLLSTGSVALHDEILEQPAENPPYQAHGYTKLPVNTGLATHARYYIMAYNTTRLQPSGAVGELCLEAGTPEQGHAHQTDEAGSRLVHWRWNDESKWLFRTGKRVRLRENGQLQYLGLVSERNTLHGHYIDAAYIESCLLNAGNTDAVAVLIKAGEAAMPQLFAYYTGKASPAGLSAAVSAKLPWYMIPHRFVKLEAMPLDVQGKVDIEALRNLEAPSHLTPHAPGTAAEKVLVECLGQVLNNNNIGLNDNFFMLGGDSIKAIQCVGRLISQGYRLEVKQILGNPVIGELAQFCVEDTVRVDQGKVTGTLNPSPVQQWFFEADFANAHHWNQDVLLHSATALDYDALTKAFEALLLRHDMLRASFTVVAGHLRQSIAENRQVHLQTHDLQAEAHWPDALLAVSQASQQSLDLQSKLMDVRLMHTPDGDYLLMVIHHLIVDGVSWRILLEDLFVAYRQAVNGAAVTLPAKTVSYKAWTHALQQYATAPVVRRELAYWKQAVQKTRQYWLPKDHTPAQVLEKSAKTSTFRLNSPVTNDLLYHTYRAYHAEVNELLIAALVQALSIWTQSPEVVISLEGHGREPLEKELDLSGTVGWFTSQFPVAFSIPQQATWNEVVAGVKDTLRAVPQHGIGYSLLRYYGEEKEALACTPQVSFNYLGQFNAMALPEGLCVSDRQRARPVSPESQAPYAVNINSIILNGQFTCNVTYSADEFGSQTMERFMQTFQQQLEACILHCRQASVSVKTAADYGMPAIHPDALQAVLKAVEETGASVEKLCALSPMQSGMLFHHTLHPASSAYFEQVYLRLHGALNIPVLEAAVNTLMAAHEALRSVFIYEQVAEPVQAMTSPRKLAITCHGLSPAGNLQATISSIKEADRNRPFDIRCDLLMRLSVIQESPDVYGLMFSFHHIILDGWSMGLVINEIFGRYQAALDETPYLPAPALPYSDYLKWIGRQNSQHSLQFWSAYLKGTEAHNLLPVISQQKNKTFNHQELTGNLPADTTKALGNWAAASGFTLNTVCQALWGILLQKYNSVDDVVFGAVVSGRPAMLRNCENTIGLFINTLPVRVRCSRETSLLDCCRQLQADMQSFSGHEHLPLPEITRHSGIAGTLVNHILVFENHGSDQAVHHWNASGKLGFNMLESEVYEQTEYALNVMLIPGQSLGCKFIYDANAFEPGIISNLLSHYFHLLSQAVAQANHPVHTLDLLTQTEKDRLLQEVNDTHTDYPRNENIVSLFLEQVRLHPDNIAITCGARQATYRQLDAQTNQLAVAFGRNGVQKGDLVAVVFDRSPELVTGMIAALKAGAAYLPLDPAMPSERLQQLITDAGVKLVYTHPDTRIQTGTPVICSGATGPETGKEWAFSASEYSAEAIAYVMYTSGSTGKPKGVKVTHRNVVRLVKNTRYLNFTPQDTFLLAGAVSFDATTLECWGSLLNGARLHILKEKVLFDPVQFEAALKAQGITRLLMTSGWFNQFADASPEMFTGLKDLMVGGDIVSANHILKVRAANPHLNLINLYGPTENGVISTAYNIGQTVGSNVPIGKPISNSTVYVLNNHLQLQPAGIVGELYVGGDGVAAGYLNNEELTAERFIRNPFLEGDRLYRTGDFVRLLPDGNIEFAGRKDFQVKIRGFRIETGEIEHALQLHSGVMEAVVTAIEGAAGKSLAAYVVAKTPLTNDELKGYLKQHLPAHMIPLHYVFMQRLPLNAHGKVDRKALPQPQQAIHLQPVAPRTETETKMIAVWSQVLSIPEEAISTHDDFFSLGGHSLKAIALSTLTGKTFGVKLSVQAIFTHPVLCRMADLLQHSQADSNNRLEPATPKEMYPVSSAQKRMYLLQKMTPEAVQYNLPQVIRVSGKDPDKIREALLTLVQRHESLRTAFMAVEEDICQRIETVSSIPVPVVHTSNDRLEAALFSQIKPFDLAVVPLFRSVILETGEEQYLFIDMHHIVTDGRSMEILQEEFAALLHGDSLSEVRHQYRDYSEWLLGDAGKQHTGRAGDYWLNRLKELPVLELPLDFQRPGEQDFKGGQVQLSLNNERYHRIRAAAAAAGVTPNVFFLSIYHILLHKLSGAGELVIGMPVSGRELQGTEAIVGMFVNTLPLKLEIKPADNFVRLVQRIKLQVAEALDHQAYPFEALLENLNISRDPSRTPVFSVLYNFIERPGQEQGETFNIYQTAKLDLSLTVAALAGGFHILLEYASALFRPATAALFLRYFNGLLDQVTASPDVMIQQLNVVTPEEQRQFSRMANPPVTTFPEEDLVSLFETQIARHPNQVAVRYNDHTLTYQQLNEKANGVAEFLQRQQLPPNAFVALCMRRSCEMIITIWGILKAGHAYLPLDPTLPAERMHLMLEDGKVRVLLGDGAITLPKEGLITADVSAILQHHNGSEYTRPAISSEHTAYSMFTSGTTGRPKGVVVKHRNVVKLVQHTNYIAITPDDRLLQWSNYAFDGSVFDIFGAHTHGASLVMIPESTVADTTRLAATILQEQISIFFITTALFNALVETGCTALKGVRKILFGGERASVHHVRKAVDVLGPDTLLHVYGPTETTVFASFYPVRAIEANALTVPIGKPLSNTSMYVLNDQCHPLPAGITGELYIGGAGVSAGYLGDEQQVQRFITINGMGRLYKTGDLGRYDEEGNILYMGRRDAQLKLRGYRIEPGEIESRLMALEAVTLAVVVCHGEEANRYLCAYYEGQPVPEETIKEALSRHLPPYMVPAFIMQVNEIPVNSNGKVNKNALPLPGAPAATVLTAPRDIWEEKLCGLWKALLKLENIGIYDDFFRLGGHSLLATRLIARIRTVFNTELPLLDVFSHPTVFTLARLIREKSGETIHTDISPVAQKHKLPLSLSQERLWFINELEGSVHYHIPGVMRLCGRLNAAAFSLAWNSLIGRHDMLRTNFIKEEGVAWQQVRDHIHFTPRFFTLHNDTHLPKLVEQEITTPFDLSHDCLIRVVVAEKTPEEHYLIVVLHHIIADGWSVPVLMEELAALYSGFVCTGTAASLPPLPIQYADYAVWQRNQLKESRMEEKLAYWKAQLQGTDALALPLDFKRPAVHGTAGITLPFHISAGVHRQLVAMSNQHGCTLFMTMMGLFQVLLHRYTGQTDFCVGTPVANRNHHQVQHMIGYFVNTLALRAGVHGDPSFAELLRRVKTTTLQGYDHQEVPFERVVEALDIDRDMSRTPLFQVMLSMHNNQKINYSLEGLTVTEEPLTVHTAQFDITCTLEEVPDGIRGTWEFGAALFETQTMQRMTGHFTQLAAQVLENPEAPVSTLQMFSKAEKACLLQHWNGVPEIKEAIPTINRWFAEVVAKHPHQLAISCGGRRLTYAELDVKANRLAHFLVRKGVRPETCVGLMMERSLNMIIAIWGIIKAGGAYVPIDPQYPRERTAYLLSDAGIRLLLTDGSQHAVQPFAVEMIAVENIDILLQEMPFYAPAVSLTPQNLLYVIYTSGSTGKPKGVMIEHGNLAVKIREEETLLRQDDPFITCLSTNYTFDVSVLEIFLPLLTGGNLHVPTPQSVSDPEALAAVLTDGKVNLLQGTPAFMQSFIEALPEAQVQALNHTLKRICIGGESFPQGLLRLLQQKLPAAAINNHYGPTEITIDALACAGIRSLDKNIIGRPLKNTVALILDQNGGMAPAGAYGELYIGGAAVARGYINSPQLNREKFVQCPIPEYAGLRFYRTGDMVRHTPEGEVEFAGRADDQVKIRGFRIELQEVEQVLNSHALVDGSVALVKENARGHKAIIAYVKWVNGNGDIAGLRTYLTGLMPEYMVPAQLIAVEAFPLNANGKIDKKRLPEPQAMTEAYEAPATETERILANIWQQVLNTDKVGRHDNFFRLGGDSIISIQVVSRSRRLGLKMHPRDVFQYQTVKLLAARCSEAAMPDGEQGLLEGESGLGPIQSWFLRQPLQYINYWNQSFMFRVDEKITSHQMAAAFDALVLRHDALRFQYVQQAPGWKQYYTHTPGEILSITDLSGADPQTFSRNLQACAEAVHGSLNITSGKLIKAMWIQAPAGEPNRLFVAIHHLAVDAVSWRIILEDLQQHLTAQVNGETMPATAKTSSYREWVAGLLQYAARPAFAAQRSYWEGIAQEPFQLPAGTGDLSPHCVRDMNTIEAVMDNGTAMLPQANHAYGTETNELLVTALSLAVAEWAGVQKPKIILEGHGREDIGLSTDLSRTVGWFTSMYPVVIDFSGATHEGDRIIQVKETLRQVPDKGLGYGIVHQQQTETSPACDRMVFNFLGNLDHLTDAGAYLQMTQETTALPIHPDNVHDAVLEISAYIRQGKLRFSWSYNAKRFTAETIEAVASACIRRLQQITSHCLAMQKQQFTPSDFPLLQLDREQLTTLLNKADSRYEVEDFYPLSPLQEGMLFHTLYMPGQEMYVEQISCTLEGQLNEDLLQQSFRHLLNKHTALRSGFFLLPSGSVQCVYKAVDMPFRSVSCIGLSQEETLRVISHCSHEDSQRAADLQQAPLMCVSLLQTDTGKHKMIWTSHHILSDGWSLPVMISGLFGTYKKLHHQTPVQYTVDKFRDYIAFIAKKNKPEAEQFWKEYLAGITAPTLLPMVSEGANRSKGAALHQEHHMCLTGEQTLALKELGNAHQVTVNTLLQAAWAFTLSAYTQQHTVMYGATVSGRPVQLPEVESRVGLYINTIPVCIEVNKNLMIGDWLRQIQDGHTRGRVHEHTALTDIGRLTGLEGDFFDSVLVFENYPLGDVQQADYGIAVTDVSTTQHTNYPLTISVALGDTLEVKLFYNADRLEQYYVQQLEGHLRQVLTGMIAMPSGRVGDISLLTPEESARMLVQWNATQAHYDHTCVHRQVEKLACLNKSAIAVVYENQLITYNYLNEEANRLAHYLINRGLKPGDPVGICLERSTRMVIAALAVMKAGGAYIPLDAGYPKDRLRYIVKDAGAAFVITSGALAIIFPDSMVEKVCPFKLNLAKLPVTNPVIQVTDGAPAYIIYTSGSTGKPKGVAVKHRSLSNLVCWHREAYGVTAQHRATQIASFGFDASVWEIWPYLTAGASLYIFNEFDRINPPAIVQYYRRHGITHSFLPTALAEPVIHESANTRLSLQYLLTGGDRLSGINVSGINYKLVNHYGPTENTVVTTCCTITGDTFGKPPIGKPIHNVQAYVLDDHQHPVPVGVPGELYIGGEGLASGYHHHPELTRSAFITLDHLISGQPTALYKTGDRVKYLPDGNLEFIGRADDQVKIRGYRIELGEIESSLHISPLVKAAVVHVQKKPDGMPFLVAYVICNGGETGMEAALKRHLSASLPDYMIPPVFVFLKEFPHTPNGKVDRKNLPLPQESATSSPAYAPPGNPVEETLASIWSAILQKEKIGIHDNFFEAGGHSLLVIRMITAIREAFHIDLPVQSIFTYNTIAALAGYMATVAPSQVNWVAEPSDLAFEEIEL